MFLSFYVNKRIPCVQFAGKYYQFKFFSKIERFASWIFGNCTRQTYTLVDGDVDKLLIENSQTDS